jgi:type II secretory pathway component PulJ
VTNTESAEWATRVTDYFGHGYSRELLADIAQAFLGLSDADAQRVYSQLKADLKTSFKVDLRAIAEAKNQLGIAGGGQASGSPQFQTVRWICQACAKVFQFNYLPAEGDEYRDIFNFCPHCGFIPRLTLYMEGNRVSYKGDQKMIERLRIPAPGKKQSTMEYYKAKRGEFFDKIKERDSELALYKDKGLDEGLARIVERRRFS